MAVARLREADDDRPAGDIILQSMEDIILQSMEDIAQALRYASVNTYNEVSLDYPDEVKARIMTL